MMNLYSNATITAEEAEILMQANKIIIFANARARNWTGKKIHLTTIFHDAVIKSHIKK